MGLRNRILRRPAGEQPVEPDPAEPTPDAPSAAVAELGDEAPATAESEAPATTDAEAATPDESAVPPEDSTVVMDAVTAPEPEPLPKGAYDPARVPQRPGFRERGRMRRRLRYLREVRELGFRDLGGLVFDQHRFGRPNETLVQGKVAAIDSIDRESRALSTALRERSDYTELFVAGVSACQRCGTLHPSDARYCPHCGLAFAGPRFLAGVGATDDQLGEPSAPGQAPLFDPHSAQAPPADPADGTPPGGPAHDGLS